MHTHFVLYFADQYIPVVTEEFTLEEFTFCNVVVHCQTVILVK